MASMNYFLMKLDLKTIFSSHMKEITGKEITGLIYQDSMVPVFVGVANFMEWIRSNILIAPRLDILLRSETVSCTTSFLTHWSKPWYTGPDTNTLTITLPGRWFSPGPSVSPTNKTDRHDITEILLKVVLSTITLTRPSCPNVYLVRTNKLRSDYFPNFPSSVNFKHIFFHHNICYRSLNMTHISANH